MKKPRTDDFDPNARTKSLKSSMDDLPTIEKPEATPTEVKIPPVHLVRGVPVALAGKRKVKSRHPFDIYEDQDEALRQLSIDDRVQGGNGSMSAMVREAIDDYIVKKRGE